MSYKPGYSPELEQFIRAKLNQPGIHEELDKLRNELLPLYGLNGEITPIGKYDFEFFTGVIIVEEGMFASKTSIFLPPGGLDRIQRVRRKLGIAQLP